MDELAELKKNVREIELTSRGKPLRELEQAMQAASDGQKPALQEQLHALRAQQQTIEPAAKSAQAEGDALYAPIFNLGLNNPEAKAGREHPDPKGLIAPMRSHDVEGMRLLSGIEALVVEVQA